ncbi:hypothetical protein ACFQU1_05905 [Chelatococcus sp. GCM10030263]|uniref:hypothetical protein n=1 Tax=Chelatococcus sp. GCM10030263 TaxID=3273387 RepID=UPI00361E7629
MLRRLSFVLPILAGLAACNTTASAPPTPAASNGVELAAPLDTASLAGKSCGEPLLKFRSLVDNDIQVGLLSPSVYKVITPDLARVAATCARGNEGQALAELHAIKSRHGYP